MSNLSPLFLVATLVVAMGAATVTQAHGAKDAAHLAELRAAAGRAAAVGPAVLVLANR